MTRITRADVEAAMRGEDADQEPESEPFEVRLHQLEQKFSEPEERAEFARLRVAKRTGLDPRLASRLVGDTDEQLEADALELLEAFPTPPRRRPTERLRSGLGTGADSTPTNPRALAALVRRGPFEW